MMFFRSSKCALKTGDFKPEGQHRGAVTVLVASTLAILLGFGALAVDVGYLFVVRNELQNAADAAALAGAGYLYPGPPTPDWELAVAKATTAVSLNKSSNVTLADSLVTYGYWDMTGINGLQPYTKTPGADDLAAVKVTINRDSGQNGGAVSLFFARIFGTLTAPVVASAVAVVSPGTMKPGALFPVAIFTCLYDEFWDSTTNLPKLATSTAPLAPGGPAQIVGKPYIFHIGSSYHTPPCPASGGAGQWTSFKNDKNDVPTLRDLIANGNPVAMGIGDNSWIQPGVENTLYENKNQPSVNGCSAAGDKSCEYVVMAVVDSLDKHAYTPIVRFACLHIDFAVGGSEKYIQVELAPTSNCPAFNSSGSGPFKPRLAQ